MLELLKNTRNSPSLVFNVLPSLEKAMSGCDCQEWPNKPTANIENGDTAQVSLFLGLIVSKLKRKQGLF